MSVKNEHSKTWCHEWSSKFRQSLEIHYVRDPTELVWTATAVLGGHEFRGRPQASKQDAAFDVCSSIRELLDVPMPDVEVLSVGADHCKQFWSAFEVSPGVIFESGKFPSKGDCLTAARIAWGKYQLAMAADSGKFGEAFILQGFKDIPIVHACCSANLGKSDLSTIFATSKCVNFENNVWGEGVSRGKEIFIDRCGSSRAEMFLASVGVNAVGLDPADFACFFIYAHSSVCASKCLDGVLACAYNGFCVCQAGLQMDRVQESAERLLEVALFRSNGRKTTAEPAGATARAGFLVGRELAPGRPLPNVGNDSCGSAGTLSRTTSTATAHTAGPGVVLPDLLTPGGVAREEVISEDQFVDPDELFFQPGTKFLLREDAFRPLSAPDIRLVFAAVRASRHSNFTCGGVRVAAGVSTESAIKGLAVLCRLGLIEGFGKGYRAKCSCGGELNFCLFHGRPMV